MALTETTDLKKGYKRPESEEKRKKIKARCALTTILTGVAAIATAANISMKKKPVDFESMLMVLDNSPALEYKVQEGDTLWDFAQAEGIRHEDGRDAYFRWVKEVNGIKNSYIHPNQTLILPDFNRDTRVGKKRYDRHR